MVESQSRRKPTIPQVKLQSKSSSNPSAKDLDMFSGKPKVSGSTAVDRAASTKQGGGGKPLTDAILDQHDSAGLQQGNEQMRAWLANDLDKPVGVTSARARNAPKVKDELATEIDGIIKADRGIDKK